MLNGLRDRIVVQADGQMKTGRDVVIAALLGAEEYGFATAPLVVSGCIMMRVCHLDTCPVGIATQNPTLRERFSGKAEFVVNFMTFIAEEVREIMAELGFRTMDEMIGHVECLDTRVAIDHWKASGLDISPILTVPENPYDQTMVQSIGQDHELDVALDQQLIAHAQPAIHGGDVGVDRSADSQHQPHDRDAARPRGHQGVEGRRVCPTARSTSRSPARPVRASVRSSRPASRCVSSATPTTTSARGCPVDVSSCTRIPMHRSLAEDQIIAGNVIAYGATSGEIFLRGIVGERFCVRNSGAFAVSEGVGDHGCEYMTGGRVVVLGPTGRNFGAGMSGGIAYVYDPEGTSPRR